ncbi:MAG TPA: DUF3054 domain-containing protein [Anaerolineae bacterium]|nr:DUF3054 domain-containing protein [Anaerolineae bacterium]
MGNQPQRILVIGDIVIFVVFAFTGRVTHAPGDANLIVNALPTLLTFLIVWLTIAVVGRVYRSSVILNPRSALRHTLIAWLSAAPIAILIRAIILSHTAVPWQFAAVTIGLVGTLLLAWHGGVTIYLARHQAS